jgi:hypothetical protein
MFKKLMKKKWDDHFTSIDWINYDTPNEFLWYEIMWWCGCWHSEHHQYFTYKVLESIYLYHEKNLEYKDTFIWKYENEYETWLLLNWFDSLWITQHWSSVYWSWLTESWKELYKNISECNKFMDQEELLYFNYDYLNDEIK